MIIAFRQIKVSYLYLLTPSHYKALITTFVKKIGSMKIIAFLLFILTTVASCAQSVTDTKLTPSVFEKEIQQSNIQLLDVRTATEYKNGHIQNALQADWTKPEEFTHRIQYVTKEKPVYIYCLAGGRSKAAADWMRANGFTKVIELEGGINAWKAANKTIEGQSTETQLTLEQYLISIPQNKTVLVDFGAKWCPPCIKMAPIIADLEKNYAVMKIDAGLHTNLSQALMVEALPVFIIYKNGKEVWRKQGVATFDELKQQLK
jgi:rhodanese-related sulfurtransferase